MTDIPPNELPVSERQAAAQQPTNGQAVKGDVIPPSGTDPWQPHASRERDTGWHKHGMRRDPLSGIFWAALLMLAGMIFLADNLGYLPNYNNADVWSWIMLGAGGLLLVEAFVRAVTPDLPGPNLFTAILGFVLLAFGAGSVFGLTLENWWPLILIVLGLSTLVRGLRR